MLAHWPVIFLGRNEREKGWHCLTSESLNTASTSSRFTFCSSSEYASLYPFLNHSSSNISAIVIRWNKATALLAQKACHYQESRKRKRMYAMNMTYGTFHAPFLIIKGFGAHCKRVWIKNTLYQFLCTRWEIRRTHEISPANLKLIWTQLCI